ncbi:MAG: PASTA domain-containing protein, partial [Mobilitalea sp.]
GTVMKQYPQAGNEREFGGEIILTISTGQQAFELPNVYGYTEENADTKLTELGLKPIHDYADSDEIESGHVISTTPERLSLVKFGDTITVTVSTGPKITKVTVPNLVGSTQADATKALTDAGLALGGVTLEASDTYAKGIVSYQNVAASGQADSGSKVDIIVSTGPSAPTNPPAGSYTYVGALNIDVNPFDYIGDGEAEIIIEIEQSGSKESLYEGMMSTEDFPYIDNAVIGNDASDATVRMIIDGDYFTVPGESSEAKWTVHFDAVEE